MSSSSPIRLLLLFALVAFAPALPAQQSAPGWLGVFAGPETAPTIAEVVPGSPAASAGLRRGDRIVALDGDETATLDRLLELLGSRPVGAKVTVRIARGGKERDVSVTLAARPPEGARGPSSESTH